VILCSLFFARHSSAGWNPVFPSFKPDQDLLFRSIERELDSSLRWNDGYISSRQQLPQ